ncbi:hypothetical protein [Capnocytophaga sp.]|uniref:hypothetical protein n=1 Tax=Capnocytophaga sp. TaxID=44737 RepID=UPI0026DC6107|nr:hypothetical protein [Capnocytophaga sp.]MDO5104601.1 hypothetical protein [Capnocytophaga sp.]
MNTLNKWHEMNEDKAPRKKYQRLTKIELHNLEQIFISEFASGKIKVKDFARKYNIEWRKPLSWKHKHFGKGSLKQTRIYQMHKAQIPSKVIAEFFNIPLPQVHSAIRTERQKEQKHSN